MGYERAMSARQKALMLVKKRDAIEAEMDSIFAALTGNGGPGLTGNLIDEEGFPRADIDVHAIRTQRHRFASLKTDHKQLSGEIERLLHVALAPPADGMSSATTSATSPIPISTAAGSSNGGASSSQRVTGATENGPRSVNAEMPPVRRRPAFAVIDEVSIGSPAEAAGLCTGDRIVVFGAVSLGNCPNSREAMRALPGLLRGHEGREVEVLVERMVAEELVVQVLKLVPNRWGDGRRGVLGCHVVPIEGGEVDDRYRPEVAAAIPRRAGGMGG